jgi:hypothetical protein
MIFIVMVAELDASRRVGKVEDNNKQTAEKHFESVTEFISEFSRSFCFSVIDLQFYM